MSATIDDHPGRIRAALTGALAGEAHAGSAAGAADLLGVAESVAAAGGFDAADMRSRGLERPSRSGSAGLLLRALPFALLTPLDRPQIRRDAYRCVCLAGADEGTAVTAIAAALLCADLLRFDLEPALLRVHQSLLEDAPAALLDELRVPPAGAPPAPQVDAGDAGGALRAAIAALATSTTVAGAVSVDGPSVGRGLAGALAGARGGAAAVAGLDAATLPHGDRASQIAQRLAERALEIAGRPADSAVTTG